MYRRVNIEPTEDELIQLMNLNEFRRNEDVFQFIEFLSKVEGNYSIFLDGKWGSGKTFFVKQVIMLLKALNKNEDCCNRGDILDIKGLNKFSGLQYRPIYYNAWHYDSELDPLLSLVGGLSSGSKKGLGEIISISKKIIKEIFTGLGHKLTGISLKDVEDVFIDNLIEPFAQENNLKNLFKELITEIVKDNTEKLILFIDELDRCSPTFAMKLLERIKFAFDDNRIILVFSTNVEQLICMTQNMYGPDTNGAEYLSRFYDKMFTLRKIDMRRYMSLLIHDDGSHIEQDGHILSIIVSNCTKNFTMRECNIYGDDLKRYIDFKEDRNPWMLREEPRMIQSFKFIILPILLALRVKNEVEFRKIVDGEGKNLFKKYLYEDKELLSVVKDYGVIMTEGYLGRDVEGVYNALFGRGPINEQWEYTLRHMSENIKSLCP